jgi:TPR repeat protein
MKRPLLLLPLLALALPALAQDLATRSPATDESHAESAESAESAEAAKPSSEALVATARRCLDGLPEELDFARGVALLREASEAGSAEAIARLGARYETGTGVPIDIPRAVALYREAAEKGCALGGIAAAACRLRGLADEPDAHEAFRRLSALAKSGDGYARLALAQCRAYGVGGVPRDPEKARRHASRAAEALRPEAEAGDPERQLALAEALFAAGGFSREAFNQAEPWFEAAAEQGEPGAHDWLVTFSLRSREFGVDPAKRRAWAERVRRLMEARAAQGAPGAMLTLGKIALHGLAGAPDAEAAVAWFRRAADAGLPEALYQLGVAYELGRGVPRDAARAREFLLRAAEGRDPTALVRLARLDLVADDRASALRRLREAAKLCAWPAQDVLKGMEQDRRVGPAWGRALLDTLFEGADHPEAKVEGWNTPEGMELLTLRWKAIRGEAPAQLEFGDRYWRGDGVPQDRAAAVEWIRKAAESGYGPAQNRLGVRLSCCGSTEESRGEAARWFRKAAEQGVEEAKEHLSFFRWTDPAAIARSYVDLYVEREAAPPAEPADRSPAARDRAILDCAAARPSDLAERVRAELLVPHEFGPDRAAPWGPQTRGALRFLADELVAGTVLRLPNAEGWGLFYDRTVRDGADDPALRWGSVVGQMKWKWDDGARRQLDALEARLAEGGATLFQRMLAAHARALLDPTDANARAFLGAADAWTATLDPAIPAEDVRTLLRGLGYSKARRPDAERLFAPSLATKIEMELVLRGASDSFLAAAIAAAEEADLQRIAAEDVEDFGLPAPSAAAEEKESHAEPAENAEPEPHAESVESAERIPLAHVLASEIVEQIGRMAAESGRGDGLAIHAEERTNSILFSGPDSDLEFVRDCVGRLDVPQTQVVVQCLVVPVKNGMEDLFGRDWIARDLRTVSPSDGSATNAWFGTARVKIDDVVVAVLRTTNARMKPSVPVVTRDGRKFSVEIGDYPYSERKYARIAATPTIRTNGAIQLEFLVESLLRDGLDGTNSMAGCETVAPGDAIVVGGLGANGGGDLLVFLFPEIAEPEKSEPHAESAENAEPEPHAESAEGAE